MDQRPALRPRDGNAKTNATNLLRNIHKNEKPLKDDTKPVSKIISHSNNRLRVTKPQINQTPMNRSYSASSIKRKLKSNWAKSSVTPLKSKPATSSFKIFEDKIKSFGKSVAPSPNEPDPNESPNLVKRKRVNELDIQSFNSSSHLQQERFDDQISSSFKFRIDPNCTDSNSLLYQAQLPLIKLNNWYSINQFSISEKYREEGCDRGIDCFQIQDIKVFNELSVLVKLINGEEEVLLPKTVVLISYKQPVPEFNKFKLLGVGDSVRLGKVGYFTTVAGDPIQVYFDWKIVRSNV